MRQPGRACLCGVCSKCRARLDGKQTREIATVQGTALSGLSCNCGAKLNRNNKSGVCRDCSRASVKAVRVSCKTAGCANEVLPTALSGLCRVCRSRQTERVLRAQAARDTSIDKTPAPARTVQDIPAEVLRDGKNRFPRRGFVVAVRGAEFEAFGARFLVPEGFSVLTTFTPDGAGGWY